MADIFSTFTPKKTDQSLTDRVKSLLGSFVDKTKKAVSEFRPGAAIVEAVPGGKNITNFGKQVGFQFPTVKKLGENIQAQAQRDKRESELATKKLFTGKDLTPNEKKEHQELLKEKIIAVASVGGGSTDVKKATEYLRKRLDPSSARQIMDFVNHVQTKGAKAAYEDGPIIHSIATDVFGKQAANWSNAKLANVFDTVLGNVGRGPNKAGLGLAVEEITHKKPVISKTLESMTGLKLSEDAEILLKNASKRIPNFDKQIILDRANKLAIADGQKNISPSYIAEALNWNNISPIRLKEVNNALIKGTQSGGQQIPQVASSTLPQAERQIAGQQISSNLSSGGSIPQSEDPVNKIIAALKEAKPIRGSQEALYTKARGEKLARAIAVGQKTSGESGFFSQLGQLKGELPKAQYESLRGKVTQQDVDSLFDIVKTNPKISEWERFQAGNGLVKILSKEGGQVPTQGELELLNRVFGKEFTKTVMSKRSTLQKALSLGGELLNLPRSLMSTLDLSAPLRQGVTLVGRKEWWKSFGSMFKQAGSEKAYKAVQDSIRAKPSYDLMKQHGLALTDMGASLGNREEAFMSNLAEKIPLYGKLVRGSNRAYSGFLNKLRADTFDNLVTQAKQTGAIDNPNFLPSLAKFVNNATGRGDLGALNKAVPVLNGLFFSPRLMASRVNMLNPYTYVKMDPTVRKEAIKAMLSFGAGAGSILGLAKLGGAEVGTDPRNADFGKIKIGNTRLDVLGGYQQYIKLAAQLATGKIISSTTGKEITVGEGYKPMTRKDIIERFFESKTAPVASLILDVLRGETSIGEPLDMKNEVVQRFVPMVTGDIVDAYNEWGPAGLAVAVPATFGMSAQTYGGTPVNLQEAEQRGDVDLYRFLKTRPKEEANQYIQNLPEDKDDTFKKFEKFKALDDEGLGENEYRMIGTGIKNGDRAKLIVNQLNKLQTSQEKNDYISKLESVGLIDDDVYDQIASMIKK